MHLGNWQGWSDPPSPRGPLGATAREEETNGKDFLLGPPSALEELETELNCGDTHDSRLGLMELPKTFQLLSLVPCGLDS